MALELSDPKPFFDFLDRCTNTESREAWSLGQPFHGGYYTEEQATAIAKWVNDPKLHFPATVSVEAVGQPPVGPRFKLQLLPKLGTFKPVKRITVNDRFSAFYLESVDAIYAVDTNGSATMRVSGNADGVKFTPTILKEAFPASLAANSSITLDGYTLLYAAQFKRGSVEDPFKDLTGKPLRFLGDKEYRIHGGVLTVGSPVVTPTPAPEPAVSILKPVAVNPVPEPVATVAVDPPVAVSVSTPSVPDDKWVEVPSSPEPKSVTPAAEVAVVAPTDPFASDIVAPTTTFAKRQFWCKMNTALLALKKGDVIFVCTGDRGHTARGLLRCKLTCDIAWNADPDKFGCGVVVCPVNSPNVEMRIRFNGSYFAVKPLFLPTCNLDAAVVMLTSVGLQYDSSKTAHSLMSVADSITFCDSA